MRKRVEATIGEVMKVFETMGISKSVADRFFMARRLGDATKALDEAKVEAKAAWKRMAFDLHPDRNNGNDVEFKRVKDVFDALIRLNVAVERPAIQFQVVRVDVSNWNAAPTATTTGTGSSWY